MQWDRETQAHVDLDNLASGIEATLTERHGPPRRAGEDLGWGPLGPWIIVLHPGDGAISLAYFRGRDTPGPDPEEWSWTDPPSRAPPPTAVGGFRLSWARERIERACRSAGHEFSEAATADGPQSDCSSTIEPYPIGPAFAVTFLFDEQARGQRVRVYWRDSDLAVPSSEAAATLRSSLSRQFGEPSVATTTAAQWRAGSWTVTLAVTDSTISITYRRRPGSSVP